MPPPGWRRNFLSKLVTSVAILFLVLYVVLCQLPRFTPLHQKPIQVLGNPRFRLQQNGKYWIYHDFIKPIRKLASGNDTITLTTHGTYMDFKKLEWLLARWNAPISLAVYVNGDDFDQTLNSFNYIKYCTILRFNFNQWVSVQLIFADNNVPSQLRGMPNNADYEFRCQAPYEIEPSNDTFSHNQEEFHYPLHLLKNVARLNAKTYFVFSTELDILPSRNLAINFLNFVKLYQTSLPLHTVYCIPIFPQISSDQKVPIYKSKLVTQVSLYLTQSHMSISLKPQDLEQLKNLNNWLKTSIPDHNVGIYRISKFPDNCAAYISINSYEPFYDQRLAESPYLDNTTRHKVLTALDFDFVVLDGPFLIRRIAAWWEERKLSRFKMPSTDKGERMAHIPQLIKFNSLTLWPRFR